MTRQGLGNFQASRTSCIAYFVYLMFVDDLQASSLEAMGEEVKENPVEEALDTELNDLVRSISSIHDHVKNITNTQLGNYSVVIDADVSSHDFCFILKHARSSNI